MCFAHRMAQPVRVPRVQDQVHMVWHQAVSPHLQVRLARLLPKKVPVNLLIAACLRERARRLTKVPLTTAGNTRVPALGGWTGGSNATWTPGSFNAGRGLR
jgi:hypothetical protein